jgi:hypothetical protein
MNDKEYWVNLLFEVQTGKRSCRNAADIIMETINKENNMTFGQEVIADTGISEALDELSNLINRLSDQITHLEEENDKLAKELSVLRELSFS